MVKLLSALAAIVLALSGMGAATAATVTGTSMGTTPGQALALTGS